MQIHVPEDLGGKLRLLPDDIYKCAIQDMFLGTSKEGNPKLTLKWVLQSEYSGKHKKDYISTIGENVLETFSLLPQAMWNLNDLYKTVTGEQLPQGDYGPEEFVALLKEQLLGVEMQLRLVTDNASGTDRSVVEERI